MPVDSIVAKERIWKEHCDKLVVQTIKARAEGRGQAEFTINPYHLQHNKPVTDPVSLRSPDFLDRPKATLQALSARLAQSGLSPRGGSPGGAPAEDLSSPRAAARINKTRAVKGNNIFGNVRTSAEAKRQLLEDWTGMLNSELGGVKSFRDTTTTNNKSSSFLPPIQQKQSSWSPSHEDSPTVASRSTKQNAADFTPQKSQSQLLSPTKRDALIQELLMRSSKPPTQKFEQPFTESQVVGWDALRAVKPDPMFVFFHKSCEMTRFAEESGHSPSKSRGGAAPAAAH